MNTRWERRDNKLKKRKDFRIDNRKSVRLLQIVIQNKAEDINGK